MIDDKFFNLFDEGLKTVAVCSICSNRYNPMEAKIVLENSNTHLIHIKCRNCQSSTIAVIMASNLGISSVGLVTDLEADDIIKFLKARPISSNEILEIHQSLNSKEKVLIDKLINN
jgi:hypothetical protein